MEEDDRALLLAWGRGDRQAGAALIERNYDGIERFFSSKAGDRQNDLTQQTFLRCAEGAAGYRGESSARAFLFGIARNVLFEHIRGRVRDGGRPPDFDTSSVVDLMPGVVTQIGQNAEQRQLILALQRLPLELQIVVELFYWEEFSIDELAECVKVPAGTIKSRLHRIRALLRESLEGLPPSDEPDGARTLLERWLLRVREHVPGDAAG
jgi:RNA polymerase sigma factor (sigma-70 family)